MAELAYAIALGAIGETLGGSNPSVRTIGFEPVRNKISNNAGVAQLVERYLAKVVVAGSTPVSRLILS